jgi:hypothetical protein
MPEAFDNAQDYSLRQGIGTVAVHQALPQVIVNRHGLGAASS